MKMKASPKDVSNKILKEFLKVSKKVDTLDVSNKEILNELRGISVKVSGMDERILGLDSKIDVVHEETMEAIHELSTQTDERFNRVDERFDGLEGRMDKNEFRLNRVESLMVTKDYLDDKLADLRSDISQNTAKQIEKALS